MAKKKSGASKGAKKINAFNDGKLEGVNVSQFIGPRVDTHLPSGGPGSLLDRRDTDFIRDQREQHGGQKGYPSDREFPSGTFPLAKKKSKKKKA